MKHSLLLATLVTITLTSCGKVDHIIASTTGHSEVCIDGVTYLQFASGATVKRLPSGQVAPCQL